MKNNFMVMLFDFDLKTVDPLKELCDDIQFHESFEIWSEKHAKFTYDDLNEYARIYFEKRKIN